jgi:MYXO-CTERM domain-containing protein
MKRYALAAAVFLSFTPAVAEPLRAAHVESDQGLVRLATGVQLAPALASEPVATARTFANLHAVELGLAGAQLGEARLSHTRLGSVVRMRATWRGLPVLGQELVVAMDGANRVRRVASSLTPIVGSSWVRRFDGLQAVERAADGLDGVLTLDGRPLGAFREVVYVRAGMAHLAFEVHTGSVNPMENWYAVVDAETGALRSRVNRVWHDDASVPAFDASVAPDAGAPCDFDAGPLSDMAMVWLANAGADGKKPLSPVTLPHLPAVRDPSGHLIGELLDAFTCCPNLGCDPANPPRFITGTATYAGMTLPFQTVFCDFVPQATNKLGCRNSYDYSSEDPLAIDPPNNSTPPGSGDPADTDVFAEVHVYYHANVAYDYIRLVGDPTFVLRDALASPPLKTQVWANFATPNINKATFAGGKVTIPEFMRVDNSAFLPKEQWAALITPDNPGDLPQTDAISLFQGPSADFGYDGEVVYHEFTHAVVAATANFGGPHLDSYGCLDEGGSMNEGTADFYAAAITNDPTVAEWVGSKMPPAPSGESGLPRVLANANRCPDDFIGEVHNDSLPFSGALWSLRVKYQGSDQGKTFDGAVFDALSTVTSSAGFKEMALAVADAMGTAFKGTAQADAVAAFTARGVIDCVKVLDYQTPRAEMFVAGTDLGYAPTGAGPIQLKIAAPLGAGSLTVFAKYSLAAHVSPIGPATKPKLNALVSLNKPITFTGPLDQITNDAASTVAFTVDAKAGTVTAVVPISAVPGDEVHLALTNALGSDEALGAITLTLQPLGALDGGVPFDAGPVGTDGGAIGVDSGLPTGDGAIVTADGAIAFVDGAVAELDATLATSDAGTYDGSITPGRDASTAGRDANAAGLDAGGSTAKTGCGCTSASASPLLGALAALALFGRRRRS